VIRIAPCALYFLPRKHVECAGVPGTQQQS